MKNKTTSHHITSKQNSLQQKWSKCNLLRKRRKEKKISKKIQLRQGEKRMTRVRKMGKQIIQPRGMLITFTVGVRYLITAVSNTFIGISTSTNMQYKPWINHLTTTRANLRNQSICVWQRKCRSHQQQIKMAANITEN